MWFEIGIFGTGTRDRHLKNDRNDVSNVEKELFQLVEKYKLELLWFQSMQMKRQIMKQYLIRQLIWLSFCLKNLPNQRFTQQSPEGM